MRKKTFSEEQIALDQRDVGMGIAELRRLRQMEEEARHSIQITVDTYGHLVPGANREAVNRLDDLLEKTGRTCTPGAPATSRSSIHLAPVASKCLMLWMKRWRAIPDETGHYWEEMLSL